MSDLSNQRATKKTNANSKHIQNTFQAHTTAHTRWTVARVLVTMRRFTEQFQRFLILLFQIRCAIPWVYNVVALRNLFSAKTIEQALFQYEIGQGALVHLSTRQHLKESKTVLALWVYKQALLGKVALGTWAAGPMVSVPQSTNSWGRDPDAVAKFYEEEGRSGTGDLWSKADRHRNWIKIGVPSNPPWVKVRMYIWMDSGWFRCLHVFIKWNDFRMI